MILKIIEDRKSKGYKHFVWPVSSYYNNIPNHQIWPILRYLFKAKYTIEYYEGITINAYIIQW
jgi:hypothetical protein